jgi:hypothetical protein
LERYRAAKERKRKSEERKDFAAVIRAGQEFSIFVFLSSFFLIVSVPVEKERRRKKEEGRVKNEKVLPA